MFANKKNICNNSMKDKTTTTITEATTKGYYHVACWFDEWHDKQTA